MSDERTKAPPESGIELAYELDAPPHKVWRALSIPEFRDKWLPQEALADPAATTVTPGREIRYRMRDDAPPFLESTVTFRIAPGRNGGTRLRIIHEPADARLTRMISCVCACSCRRTGVHFAGTCAAAAANSNGTPLMRAA